MWVRIPPEGGILFLSKGSEPVSVGVVVLPCFVFNRSHRFHHLCPRATLNLQHIWVA